MKLITIVKDQNDRISIKHTARHATYANKNIGNVISSAMEELKGLDMCFNFKH